MSKEKKKGILLVLGALAAVLASYFLYRAWRYEGTDDAYVQAHALMLSARIGGTVESVTVDENDKVKAGQVLARIDNQDATNAYHQAQADVEAVAADYRQAERDYARMQQLFKDEAIPQSQLDAALARDRNLAQRLKAAQAKADQAQLDLSYTLITAPDDGAIARRSAEAGMVVPQGQALFGFVSSRERWITANFKETQLHRLREGQKVDVEVDALPGKDFEGEVEGFSSSTGSTFTLLPPDNSTGNFTKVVQRVPVRIKLLELSPEDIDRLQAGLSAVVHVKVN